MKNKYCDIVVLGGGGSGLVAAVRAAFVSGVRVIVLEKAKVTGGGALFASTMRTFGSNWQKKRGIPDHANEYLQNVMDETYWQLDSQLAANCIRGTGEFFDWLCELEPEIENQFFVGKYVFDGPDAQLGPQNGGLGGGSGRLIMDAMLKKGKELGVEILTGHRAVDVETEDGKISAVIAESAAGTIKISCKACILATGSWIRNKEIVERVCPEFNQAVVKNSAHLNPNYTGDGIPLAEKAGAYLDYDSFCLRIMGPVCTSSNQLVTALAESQYPVLVNLQGKRFTSEPMAPRMDFFDTGHVLIQQPKATAFFLFDAKLAEIIVEDAGKPHEDSLFPAPEFPDSMEEIYAELDKAAQAGNGHVFKADSIQELADQMQVDATQLAETVNQYNEACRTGVDWNYFRNRNLLFSLENPPFYAVRGVLFTDGAFGGVLVNADMQAYRKDKSLLEGLFVTGDFASGRHINLGGVKKQLLNDMSWAFSSGYIAGNSAVRYLSATV